MPNCSLALLLALSAPLCPALTPRDVLVIGNARSPLSKSIVEYYARQRSIPADQVLFLKTAPAEEIDRREYDKEIAAPIAAFLQKRGWVDRILAIVTTTGVPLKIKGTDGLQSTAASVDSELATLYGPTDCSGPKITPPGLNAA